MTCLIEDMMSFITYATGLPCWHKYMLPVGNYYCLYFKDIIKMINKIRR